MSTWHQTRNLAAAVALAVTLTTAHGADELKLWGEDAKWDGIPVRPVGETEESYHQKMKWFEEARFSIQAWMCPGTYGGALKMDPTNIQQVREKWNPKNFDANALVALLKDAGARYTYFNAVWPDSFAMWDTKLTEHNIMKHPYGKDILREVADACRKHGVAFMIYTGHHSAENGPYKYFNADDDSKFADDPMTTYEELMGYEPAGFWFDNGHVSPQTIRRMREINPVHPAEARATSN